MNDLIPPNWPADKMFRGLACDGERNGDYITAREAFENGYELVKWPTGEYVYMQAYIKLAQAEDDYLPAPELHPEDVEAIKVIVREAPLR
jgi:hypothetical protein